MGSVQVGIVIPVFNEQARITHSLRALDMFRHGMPVECLVVDDGSTDETRRIVERFRRGRPWLRLMASDRNMGKGAAVREGMRRLDTPFIFFIDADMPVALDALDTAKAVLEKGADMVIGSRRHPKSQVIDRPVSRKLIGAFGNLLIRAATRLPYLDTQCGFKGFRRRCAHDLFACLESDGYLFDVELLILAREKGYNVVELPVRWSHVPDGSFRPAADSVRALFHLVRLAIVRKRLFSRFSLTL